MLKKLPTKSNKIAKESINTLLVDGNALFKTGYHGAKNEINRNGEHIGGIYQFLTMVRKLMTETIYDNIYVFWDGEYSGKLRFEFYPKYKSNRDKVYDGEGTKPLDDENQIIERLQIQAYLEELYIKQLEDSVVESDDFIAYYTLNKQVNENITICTNDLDICQLVRDGVRVYRCDKKIYVTHDNYNEIFGHHYKNVALIKMLIGDSSDAIKGVKGLGLKTILNIVPTLMEREVTLSEIMEVTKEQSELRKTNNKKPLKVLENILNGVTDGDFKGELLYEVNYKLVDLTKPLLTETAKENIHYLIDNPLVGERNMKNVITMIKEHGLIDKIGSHNLDNYLLVFKKYVERHKKQQINY